MVERYSRLILYCYFIYQALHCPWAVPYPNLPTSQNINVTGKLNMHLTPREIYDTIGIKFSLCFDLKARAIKNKKSYLTDIALEYSNRYFFC